jgi:hypothetical protein
LDLTSRIGRGFIAFLSAMAEDERQRIVKRANDGPQGLTDQWAGSALGYRVGLNLRPFHQLLLQDGPGSK